MGSRIKPATGFVALKESLAELPQPVITRFAPSPTGWLHLGHLLNALLVWGVARARGGKVLLRIEDHDRTRYRPEYARAIEDDLFRFGFVADGEALYQSARIERYREAADILSTRYGVYSCCCTRSQLKSRCMSGDGGEMVYDGACRSAARDVPQCNLRVHIPDESIVFDDLWQGPLIQNPARQCGDPVLFDVHGNPTYQFAVTVDDFDQGINTVIRGLDLLSSTGRQILLGCMLGRSVSPRYAHHALIHETGGCKLSKRDGALGLRAMLAAGLEPERICGQALFRAGYILEEVPVAPDDICAFLC